MGPFPHDAPPATICAANPAGTDGFEFVEFAHPEPDEAGGAVRAHGLRAGRQAQDQGHHASGARATSTTSSTPSPARMPRASSPSMAPARRRWPGASSMPGTPSTMPSPRAPSPIPAPTRRSTCPAIVGIGGSLLYFVDTYGAKGSAYDAEFDWLGERDPQAGRRRLLLSRPSDPQRLSRQHGQVVGILPRAVQFQADPLLRHRGQASPAWSAARITSPCGKIRIPLNEIEGRHQPDRGISAEVQGRGHPAHRRRHARRSTTPPTRWPPTA